MKTKGYRYLFLYVSAVLVLMISIASLILLGIENATHAVREHGPVETGTAALYLICSLLLCFTSFEDRLVRFALAFIFLNFFAREINLPALLGTSPVKLAMFRDPDVTNFEKASVILVVGSLIFCVGYLIVRYSRCVLKGAVQMDPVYFGIVLGLILMAVSQTIDMFSAHESTANHYSTVAEEMLELGVAIVFLISILIFKKERRDLRRSSGV